MLLIAQKLRRTVEAVLVLSLLAMVGLTFADVVGRRFFNAPVYGAHDLTEHLMALIVFCGLPLVTAARGHLCIDLFDKALQHPAMRWWQHLIAVAIAAVLLLIAWQFMLAASEARDIREVSQELSIERSYMYAFMALTSVLSALAALLPRAGGGRNEPQSEEAL